MRGKLILVERQCRLRCRENRLEIEDEDGSRSVFLEDIAALVLASREISVSVFLLGELAALGAPEPPAVLPGDPSNAEGRYAELYFRTMFGRNFRRGLDDDITAALNYGYVVLTSAAARIAAAHASLREASRSGCLSFRSGTSTP